MKKLKNINDIADILKCDNISDIDCLIRGDVYKFKVRSYTHNSHVFIINKNELDLESIENSPCGKLRVCDTPVKKNK